MKRGTPTHPKTLALAAALGLPRWGAVGILESLWHFGASYARRGDIGRHSDAQIAIGIGWQDDARRLVAALVDTGWLDRCSCHRLRIHDWPVHADRAVAKTQEVVRMGWLECYAPRQTTVAQDPGGPAGNGDGSGEGAIPEDDGGDSRGGSSSDGWLESHAPRQDPGGPAGNGDGSGGRTHACHTRVARVGPAGAGAGAGAGANGPPYPRRLAPTGDLSIEAQRRRAVRYWCKLGGRPGRQDRRQVYEALVSGRPLAQVLGSIACRVRDDLVARGRLAPTDPWPPPGLAPFDPPATPPPEAQASPADVDSEAGAIAWAGAGEALRAKLSPEAWATWIRPCRGLYVREGRIVVEVPDARFLDWIGRNWSAHLQWAAAETGLEGVDLVVASAPAIAG